MQLKTVSTAFPHCQKHSIVRLDHVFFIRPSVARPLGCFCFLVVMCSVAVDTGARVCVWTDAFIPLGHTPSETAGSHGHSTCHCSRNSRAASHSGCAVSYSFPAATRHGANSCACPGLSCYYSHPNSCCESMFLNSAVKWPSRF